MSNTTLRSKFRKAVVGTLFHIEGQFPSGQPSGDHISLLDGTRVFYSSIVKMHLRPQSEAKVGRATKVNFTFLR